MIKTFIWVSLMLMTFCGFSQQATYDSTLARSLGADDYGMRQYVLVILKTGTYTPENQTISDSLFREHMHNIQHLAEAGNLVVAGPISSKNDRLYRGIFIFNTASIDQAKEWLEGDLAIKAKVFDVELYNWYGSAALPAYLPVHSKIEKARP